MQVIVSGAGDQPVEIYATDALGRIVKPSSASARIVDLDLVETDPAREILASTAATVDTLSTTLTAAAGPREANARVLTVASAAGFTVGRTYVVTGGGAIEAFVVERVDGLDVWARDELRTRFAIGATVTGARVSVDFPAATADDATMLERDAAIFGVDWTIVGTTGPAIVRTMVRIERRRRQLRATVADLFELDPRIAPASHARTTLDRHLARADREISARLMYGGHVVERESDGEIGMMAVSYRALELCYRTLGQNYEDRAVWANGEFKRWERMLVNGTKATDQAETTRATDRITPRRRPGVVGVIT